MKTVFEGIGPVTGEFYVIRPGSRSASANATHPASRVLPRRIGRRYGSTGTAFAYTITASLGTTGSASICAA